MAKPSPQPNVLDDESSPKLPPRFWLLVIITGVGAGLGASALMALLRLAQHLSFSYSHWQFQHAVEMVSDRRRVLVLVAAGVLTALAPWLLRKIFKKDPGQVCKSIWFEAGQLPFVHTVLNAALSIILVGMGTSVGREGAPKEVGATIGSKLSNWAKLTPAQRRLLVACGAGAGMGAVYNVPFGGALFAVEVLLGTLALPLVVPALLTAMIATAVSWITLPIRPTYTVPTYHLAAPVVVWAIVLGPLAGLVSVLYIKAIAWATENKPKRVRGMIVPLVVFTGLGFLSIPYPQLLGNGKDLVQQVFFGQHLGILLLIALFLLKPTVTSGCLSSGAPGGLFTPTITTGALFGALLGSVWNRYWPGSPLGSYSVVAAAAFLAAATQGPVSSLVLVLELTRYTDSIMVPMLLAVAGATLVSRYIDPRSIYSARIVRAEKDAKPPGKAAGTAFDDLISVKCGVVSAATRYMIVLERMIKQTDAQGPLYVVDEKGKLTGQITPETIDNAGHMGAPLEARTASDITVPVRKLSSTMQREEVRQQLKEWGEPEVPVVDAKTEQFLGVVRVSDLP